MNIYVKTYQIVHFIFFLILNLFIYFYFWLRWVFVAVRGLLIAESSLVGGARALGTRASVVVARGL